MHPPEWVCEAVYRKYPQLRLAWAGRDPDYPGEINPGGFAIVQLYHVSDCGDIDEPITYREYWDVTNRVGEDGTVRRVRIDRGPIFARNGSTRRDWDSLFRFPIFCADLSAGYEFPWGEEIHPIKDVMNGRILLALDRDW